MTSEFEVWWCDAPSYPWAAVIALIVLMLFRTRNNYSKIRRRNRRQQEGPPVEEEDSIPLRTATPASSTTSSTSTDHRTLIWGTILALPYWCSSWWFRLWSITIRLRRGVKCSGSGVPWVPHIVLNSCCILSAVCFVFKIAETERNFVKMSASDISEIMQTFVSRLTKTV